MTDTQEEHDKDWMKSLVRLRHVAGFTQADVAEKMGVNQGWVSELETSLLDGGDPRLSTLRRYAKAINVLVMHAVDPGEVDDASEEEED